MIELINEPRNTRHMPLSNVFTEETAAEWVAAKDAQWEQHGYGPWAVLIDGEFAGWGGFQREENGADFGLVLRAEALGRRGRRSPGRRWTGGLASWAWTTSSSRCPSPAARSGWSPGSASSPTAR